MEQEIDSEVFVLINRDYFKLIKQPENVKEMYVDWFMWVF